MARPIQMEYRSLGSSSLKVSAISYGGLYTFGCKLQDVEAKNVLRFLYDSGVNFFDNGEFYGGSSGRAEVVMGRAIKDLGWKRSGLCACNKHRFSRFACCKHPALKETAH
ncbi:putative NADP-dependent oxidoreductase domain-containing protein [Helianthus annuus]|nr:putative NADP-dependent oxidoreductase domain-containing protein [Helianthus annuus]